MTETTTSPARIEHRIGARGRFALQQPAGDVTIRGVEGDAARVRSLDERPLGERFEIVAAAGSLELRPLDRLGGLLGIWRRDNAPSLAVEVPHGAGVTIEAASADVSASDLTGDKRIRTASGDVSLARLAGAVDVATVSGEIQIEGQVQIDVVGRTVSGDVALRLPQIRRLDLATTSGDALVDAELAGAGPFDVRTISGDLTVVARGGFRIEAQTVTGDLGGDVKLIESGRGRKVATVGRAGPTLTFRSVSGDVVVVGPAGRRDRPAARPGETDATAAATPAAETPTSDAVPDDARLAVLRALERGEISVSEAGHKLTELEEVVR